MIFFLRTIIFPGLLLIPFFVFSQNRTIEGRITDASSGEKLAGAGIYVLGKGTGTIAGKEGYYSLSLPEGEYLFRFSYVGHEVKEMKIRLKTSLRQDIQLKRSDLLEEVVISSRRKDENF
ncbi:MAG: carboxypeptidase-like regulatory domain-containing protein, partial [Candidatus Symbiothrix sp.]|nr:carboxypeptidase-like regulatory domain-containing protein [Candidatus Symbiothrix sp.]